jgi:hypothetical protein
MTQKQKKSRERRNRRDMADGMAGTIMSVMDFRGRPESAANLAKLDAALKTAIAVWCTHISCNLDIAPKFLHMVADALEGKLHGAKYDALIKEAYHEAANKGKRKDERNFPFRPLFSEFYDALLSVLKKKGYKDDEMPDEDAMRARLKLLGYLLSKKQGRHRGEKNATRTDSKTVAAKSPLTSKEKKEISDLEWSGVKHAVIEDEIGKRYKRTDDGDYIAVLTSRAKLPRPEITRNRGKG